MKAKQVILTILITVVLHCTLALVPTASLVYASGIQDVAKGNEQSFAGGDFTGIPDLTIANIDCGPDNKLLVTIINQDNMEVSYPYTWEAVGEVYFDDNKMGVFDLREPTSTKGGGIDCVDGSSTYLLPWEIPAPVTVRVTLIATNTHPVIDAIFTKTTSLQARFEIITIKTTSNTISGWTIHVPPYLPLLLGLAGFIVVVLAIYGSRLLLINRLFHRTSQRH